MPGLQFLSIIASNFSVHELSDFKSICRDRTFYVHILVLHEYGYFKTIISGPWKEGESQQVDLSEDEPLLVECMLRYLYGEDYEETMKLLLLPPESYPEIPQEIRVPSARTRNKAIFMVDPSPALSEYHCHELMQHAKMYRIAEFYQLETLKETATSSFFKVVCDCWNSPAKLDVVRYVYGISVDKNKLRLIIVDELTDRVNSLRNSIAFKALLNEIPALAVDLIWNMCMHPPVLSSATDTRYCTFFDCRKTRSTLGSFRSERTVTNDEGEEVMVPHPMCTHCYGWGKLHPPKNDLWPEDSQVQSNPLLVLDEDSPSDESRERGGWLGLSRWPGPMAWHNEDYGMS